MAKLPEWNLKTIYRNEASIRRTLEEIETMTHRFKKYRSLLEKKPTRQLVEEIMRENEALSEMSHRVGTYSMLRFAENTQDEQAKALQTRITQFFTRVGNETLFFGLWWKNLSNATARKLLPRNTEHAYALWEMRKYKKHLLSEKEEQLINLKDANGIDALGKLYEITTNGYLFPWKKGKKTILLSEEEIRSYMRSARPEERVQAYHVLWKKYEENNGVLGEIYVNMVHNYWNENITLRKYDSPISVRNLANDLDDELVSRFLTVCQENTHVFSDYLSWKTKTLKQPYSRYHLYAPFPSPSQKWSFEEGYQTVMHAYEDFSPRFQQEAHRVLREKHLDAALRKGKRGGAFCADATPKETAFVLLNWTHKLQDVYTLAHELGHATHDHLASSHSIFLHQAPLPLAETASTFGEMLLTQKLVNETTHPTFQRYLLAHELDEAYSTIQRQSFFCLFEIDAFEHIHAGKGIPEINERYYSNLRKQLGKKMEIPTIAQYEWTMISHFFETPFYVYAYAFGQLLVLALWDMYQEEGKSFISRYEKFLSYGGSTHPEKMLLEIGFDPHKKTSWRKGFHTLREKVKELKRL